MVGKIVACVYITSSNMKSFMTAVKFTITAEVLRAKIDRKSAISLQCGHLNPKFQAEGDVPHQ